MSDNLQDLPVLTIWLFKLRRLSVDPGNRKPFYMRSASRESAEALAVGEIRQRFTPSWWDGVIIQEVTEEGPLHMVAGVPLYEVD